MPLGTVILQPMTTPATVNPKRTTWTILKELKAPAAGAAAVPGGGLPISIWTSLRTAMGSSP